MKHTLFKYRSVLFFILVIITLLGCHKEHKKKGQHFSTIEKRAELMAKKLDLKGIPETQLSPKTQKAVASWTAFLSLNSAVRNFKEYSIQNVVNHKDNLLSLTKTVKDSLPKDFNTRPIQSRINVLLTRIRMFRQLTGFHQNDTDKLQEYAREIYRSFSALKIQMNEVFVQKNADFKITMDAEQDSIRQNKQKKESEHPQKTGIK